MCWIERHSVGCYFCGALGDERMWQRADPFNNDDGGHICDKCLELKVSCGNCAYHPNHGGGCQIAGDLSLVCKEYAIAERG